MIAKKSQMMKLTRDKMMTTTSRQEAVAMASEGETRDTNLL
jgi:hypothetical protein